MIEHELITGNLQFINSNNQRKIQRLPVKILKKYRARVCLRISYGDKEITFFAFLCMYINGVVVLPSVNITSAASYAMDDEIKQQHLAQ